MSKIRLIYKEGNHPNFMNGDIQQIVEQWFTIERYDPAVTYNPRDTVLLITHVEVFGDDAKWYQPMEQAGFRVIVDHLWDSDVDTPTVVKDGRLILRCGNWVWYRECVRFITQGYHTYQPQRAATHAFFMPMHKLRWHRDQALERLAPVLQHALWSYVERGSLMPGDVDHSIITNIFWEFYVNPEWYNSTFFSVVVESYMRSNPWFADPRVPNYRTEVSEKTFKPLMYHHPLVVYGSNGTLEYLQREGFATFDNLWDESYDQIRDDHERHAAVSDLIINNTQRWLAGDLAVDAETTARFQHNHARVFDIALVRQRIESEIIAVIQEFLAQ